MKKNSSELRLWPKARFKLATKEFIHGYNLPLAMTLLFIAAIAGLYFVRAHERTLLAGLAPSTTVAGQDYYSLISGDKMDKTQKGNSSSDSASNTSIPNDTALNINPGTSEPSDSSPGGSNEESPGKFQATIISFGQSGSSLDCPGLKLFMGRCTKTYTFNAQVRTINGPGAVNYNWISNADGADESASFSTGSGETSRTLTKQIAIRCNRPGDYTLQLSINSPLAVQSNIITFHHGC